MKKCFLLLSLMLPAITYSQGITLFKYLKQSMPLEEMAVSMLPLSDGTMIAIGGISSAGVPPVVQSDVLVVKLTADGDTIWTRKIGDIEAYEAAGRGVVTADDRIVFPVCVASAKGASGANLVYRPKLVCMDANGLIEWEKQYMPASNCDIYDAKLVTDGILMCGAITKGNDLDAVIYKTSFAGDSVWYKAYDDGGLENAYAIEVTPDGTITMVGDIAAPNGSAWDAWILQVDKNGKKLFSKTLAISNKMDFIEGIAAIYDNGKVSGYMLTGATNLKNDMSSCNMLWMRIDTAGNTVWDKSYGTPDIISATNVKSISNGMYMICGLKNGSNGLGQAYVVKVDANGNIAWDATHAQPADDIALRDIAETKGGEYIGIGDGINKGANSLYIIKVKNGITGISKLPGKLPVANVVPNPANAYFDINMPETDQIQTVYIIAEDGKLLDTYPKVNASTLRIETKSYTAGKVYVRISTDASNITIPIIINH